MYIKKIFLALPFLLILGIIVFVLSNGIILRWRLEQLPQYPGAEKIKDLGQSGELGNSYSFLFKVDPKIPKQKVITFYTEELSKKGWRGAPSVTTGLAMIKGNDEINIFLTCSYNDLSSITTYGDNEICDQSFPGTFLGITFYLSDFR